MEYGGDDNQIQGKVGHSWKQGVECRGEVYAPTSDFNTIRLLEGFWKLSTMTNANAYSDRCLLIVAGCDSVTWLGILITSSQNRRDSR
eukprot:676685-Hanusia_phi.AAC.3